MPNCIVTLIYLAMILETFKIDIVLNHYLRTVCFSNCNTKILLKLILKQREMFTLNHDLLHGVIMLSHSHR